MPSLRQKIALSDHALARAARAARRRAQEISVPAPRVVVRPLLWAFLLGRTVVHGARRILIAEPLFKAYCRTYGKRLRTGIFVHWVQGRGDIIAGDDVLVDGKCTFTFAARFSERPTLRIGSHTGIGHNCAFTVAKEISIGSGCRIASDVWMFDSPGHPLDPAARRDGRPPADADVRPIRIGDNVWIGRRAIIFPGVVIGEGSVISAGAVVMQDVPPCTVAAGNPARRVASVPLPDRSAEAKPAGPAGPDLARPPELRNGEPEPAAHAAAARAMAVR